jgi:hypothetical protein
MGVCLCKDKVSDDNSEDQSPYTNTPDHRCNGLSERVDELVKETLEVIASIVDDEPETPNSMLLLHDITDRPRGWLCLVKSLIRVVSSHNCWSYTNSRMTMKSLHNHVDSN